MEEETRSVGEQHYICLNPECGSRYRLFLRHPTQKKEYGIFACLLIALRGASRETSWAFLTDEFFSVCPVCDKRLCERSGKIFRCPDEKCGVSVEFYFQQLLASLVVVVAIVVCIPEPGFSKVLSRNLEPNRYN
ncbi:MAG: hypothetical protein HYS73_00415 [Parcubacteria group bacterium]|nr:hypothetical protein [Parcubacteria group bacterium]